METARTEATAAPYFATLFWPEGNTEKAELGFGDSKGLLPRTLESFLEVLFGLLDFKSV
jgi:hypothetical protein